MKNHNLFSSMRHRVIQNPQKIWISSPHNLGDLVAKVPMIRTLKRAFPNLKIALAARDYSRDLAAIIDEIDEFHDFEAFFAQKEEDIILQLKQLNFDVMIHILSQQKAMGPDVLGYAQKANIPTRIGNVHRSWTALKLKGKQGAITHNLCQKRIIQGVHEYQWNMILLKFFGLLCDESLEKLSELMPTQLPTLKTSPWISKDKFNLIIHPGSFKNAKDWPQKSFKELIARLQKDPIHIIVTGSKEEAHAFEDFKSLKNVRFAMGQCSLKELIWLISQAGGLIAASTGPAHIAALLQTPTLTLFPKQSSMSADVWAPLGYQASTLSAPKICTYCQHKLTDFNPNLCQCMHSITVDNVYKHILPWFAHESSVR